MRLAILTAIALSFSTAVTAQGESNRVLFTDCRIFDGLAESLTQRRNILVENNLIASIGDAPLSAEGAEVIDCEGRTLMPGLIDAHTHLYMNMPGGVGGMEAGTWDEIGTRAVHMANEYLHSGFTTVREMGGGGSGLKKTVDGGLVEGPRIYPSGAFVSQTSGHGDLRNASQRNPNLPPYANDSSAQRLGITLVADGEDAVLSAVRQNLSQGATQIKLMAGGVSLPYWIHFIRFSSYLRRSKRPFELRRTGIPMWLSMSFLTRASGAPLMRARAALNMDSLLVKKLFD